MNVSYSSLPVFLPTILKEMGFSSINAQGLTAPPFFLSFLVTCFSTWIADRTQQRGLMVIILSIIGGIGYIILATCHSTGVKYFGVFLAAAGVEAPQYVKGMSISAAFMFFNALLAFGNRCLLQWENKKLDRKYGVVDRETQQSVRDGKLKPDANVGEENYGAMFRYIL